MTKSRVELTELEGAILGVLRRSDGLTAYAVRSVFLKSRSAEWSGSAGAVYPALARLTKAGLVTSRSVADKRGSKISTLTRAGRAALEGWVCDVVRAAGPGLDPFRARAANFAVVAPAKRRALIAALIKELEAHCAALQAVLASLTKAESAAEELHIALLETRLAWLARQG